MQQPQSKLPAEDILSQADIILPSQYFGTVGSVGLTGEQRLMLAVLVDAINVVQSWKGSGSARKRRNFAEAAQWINTVGTTHPFSFDSVCDALSIDSQLLRSRLRILTVRPANSVGRPSLARLRLKELSRSQHLTPNRSRRREHVVRAATALMGRTTGSPSRWDGIAEQTRDRMSGTTGGFTAERPMQQAASEKASWR
jgi:hypothetical protein